MSFTEEFYDALLDAFTDSQMERLLKFRLDIRFDRIVGPGSREDRFFELLEYLEGKDRLPEFAIAARDIRPRNEELRAFASGFDGRHRPSPLHGDLQTTLGSEELGNDAPSIRNEPDAYLRLLINREEQTDRFADRFTRIGREPPFQTQVFFVRGTAVDKPEDFIARLKLIEFKRCWSAMPEGLDHPECRSIRVPYSSANLKRFTTELKKKFMVPQHTDDQLRTFLGEYDKPLLLSTWIDAVEWDEDSAALVRDICRFWSRVESHFQPICHLFIIEMPTGKKSKVQDLANTGVKIDSFAAEIFPDRIGGNGAAVSVLGALSPISQRHATSWVRHEVADYCEEKDVELPLNELTGRVSGLFADDVQSIALKDIEDRLWNVLVETWREAAQSGL